MRSEQFTDDTSSISAKSDASVDSLIFDPNFGKSLYLCGYVCGGGKVVAVWDLVLPILVLKAHIYLNFGKSVLVFYDGEGYLM